MDRTGTSIDVLGVKKTIRALKAFAPEVEKRLNNEIRKSLRRTRDRALSKYPKGAYTVQVNAKKILGTVLATPGGTRAKRWGDSAPGIKAAVFEFAGSRQRGETPQARRMIESLNARYGQPGRFLWSAWDETGKDVLSDIKTALKRAERDLQATLDASGER